MMFIIGTIFRRNFSAYFFASLCEKAEAGQYFYARSQNYGKSLLASSCLSVRMEQQGCHRTDLKEI
jgi:hypothetical protein